MSKIGYDVAEFCGIQNKDCKHGKGALGICKTLDTSKECTYALYIHIKVYLLTDLNHIAFSFIELICKVKYCLK